jgi:outer membrane receptor protein involved in Fe transport
LSDREVGVRVNATWRSSSVLNTALPGSVEQLRFSALATIGLRTFADLGQLWPGEKWSKDTRVSFNIANLFNQRQRVADRNGLLPLSYQPGYRDPLGRTVEIELRKSF